MKKKMIIALDSKTGSHNKDLYELFEKYGFLKTSPKKHLDLPESTYIGKVGSKKAGKKIVQKIWNELKERSLSPTHICGGIIDDWKVICKRQES